MDVPEARTLSGWRLNEQLDAFMSDTFDADEACQEFFFRNPANIVDEHCRELVEIRELASSTLRRAVSANYTPFIKAAGIINDIKYEFAGFDTALRDFIAVIDEIVAAPSISVAVPCGAGLDWTINNVHESGEDNSLRSAAQRKLSRSRQQRTVDFKDIRQQRSGDAANADASGSNWNPDFPTVSCNDIFTGTGAHAEFPAEIDLANVWGVTEKSGVDSF